MNDKNIKAVILSGVHRRWTESKDPFSHTLDDNMRGGGTAGRHAPTLRATAHWCLNIF
jgi:hypothetical protein